MAVAMTKRLPGRKVADWEKVNRQTRYQKSLPKEERLFILFFPTEMKCQPRQMRMMTVVGDERKPGLTLDQCIKVHDKCVCVCVWM